MSDTLQDNKRIAKNTLMLYVRMLMLMGISLFTSRVNLQLLGVTDFGIFNAVGGLVGMFAIISGSMSVAISRYLTYELGKGNKKKLNDIFCTSINIQLFISVVIIIIAEIIGIWFLNTKMNIPADRMYSANWVFQCSIFTFVIGLISVPYNALIISHEKMSAFAYISILEAVLKLLICYGLYVSPFDRLIVWGIMLALVQLLLRLIYGYYCRKHFEEAEYHLVFNKPLIKEMSKFIGWATFGNGVVVLKDQGTNVLLNIFCGPVVNAARGIAMQVNGVACQLVANFMMATNPQITKSYSGGNIENMHNLIIRSGKLSFLLLCLLFFPLWPNIDAVLKVWLVEVPDHTAPFVLLILAYSMLDCFASPLITGVLSEGNIKRFEISITVLYLLNIGASYLLLKHGYEPEWIFVMNILFKGLVIGALLLQSKRMYGFPIRRFFRQSVVPSMTVVAICTLVVCAIRQLIKNGHINLFGSAVIILIFTSIAIYIVGLTKAESAFIITNIKSKILKFI